MGRAMLIICAGLLIAVGYTYMNVSERRQSMGQQNISTFNGTMAQNAAHTGIQIAIQKFNDDKSWRGPETVQYEGADLTIALSEVGVGEMDTIKVTSVSTYSGVKDSVTAIFDISKKQPVVPEFPGALTSVGNGNIDFQDGNNKVHFEGIPPAGTSCPEKPGFIVPDPNDVDDYENNETINGNPDVTSGNSIKYEEIEKIIEALAPHATIVNDDSDFTTEPQVYFINDSAHLDGKTEGYGILVVRNDAVLDIDADVDASGQFTFHGLVIFENETNFSGTGKAVFDGAVVAATNDYSTFNIKANGNFVAQYNCTSKQYADDAVDNALNTTIYDRISIYE